MLQNTLKVLQKITFYLCAVSALIMFFTMLLIVGDVVGRHFERPITGTYELVKYLLVMMVLLGIGYAQQTGQHVAVDFFIGKLPTKGRRVFEVAGTMLGLIFFSLVTWQGCLGGLNAIKHKTVSDTLHIPLYPFEFMIGIGTFFLVLELLIKLATLTVIRKSAEVKEAPVEKEA